VLVWVLGDPTARFCDGRYALIVLGTDVDLHWVGAN
jgi:hypothetical protein